MDIHEEASRIGRMIDAYAASAKHVPRWGVASQQETDHGVPPEMWLGEPNHDGWVEWRVLPSSLTLDAISKLESEFCLTFPRPFQAYLLARFHCFDQLQSQKYKQLIMFPDLRTRDPLRKLRDSLQAWRALIKADLIPFAEWGDGWGPMCFDANCRNNDNDCPILWLDHEQIIPLGEEKCKVRSELSAMENPLYNSSREMLWGSIRQHIMKD